MRNFALLFRLVLYRSDSQRRCKSSRLPGHSAPRAGHALEPDVDGLHPDRSLGCLLIGALNIVARRSLIRMNASALTVPYQLARFVRRASNISGSVDWLLDSAVLSLSGSQPMPQAHCRENKRPLSLELNPGRELINGETRRVVSRHENSKAIRRCCTPLVVLQRSKLTGHLICCASMPSCGRRVWRQVAGGGVVGSLACIAVAV